jgi:ABC-type glutathione transport system ATPase component
MGIPFDTYLVDEVTSVGDAAFKKKSGALFHERMRESGSFVVSHSMPQVRELCDVGIVLEHGRAVYYDDLEAAIAHHLHNMDRRGADQPSHTKTNMSVSKLPMVVFSKRMDVPLSLRITSPPCWVRLAISALALA